MNPILPWLHRLLRLVVLVAFAATIQLHAVNPVPYTEGVSFSFKINGVGGGMMTVYGEGDATTISHATDNASTESVDMGLAWLRPGKKYTVYFQASGPAEFWLSYIAPQGYELYIQDQPRDLIYQYTGGGEYGYDYLIELRPIASSIRADFGAFGGMALGRSVTWDVALGGLVTGRSAGRLLFKEQDFSTANNPASRDRLYVSIPPNSGEITVFMDGPSSQAVRQVAVPAGIVDLLDEAGGGYSVRFFTWAQAEGSPGNPYILHGDPWKTIRVESTGANYLLLTETEGTAVRVSEFTASGPGDGNYTATLREGGPGGNWQRTTTHVSTDYPGNIATGGTVITSGGYTSHTFLSNDTFIASSGIWGLDAVLVAGGGGGGMEHAGGGGAGGLLALTGRSVAAGSYSITVGAGGAGSTWSPTTGENGGNSSAFGQTAIGGGAGTGMPQFGNDGGSGGGDGYPSGGVQGGNGTPGQGNPGSRDSSLSTLNGGGGGGAGGPGSGAYGGSALATWAGTFAGGGGGGYAGGPGGGAGAGAGGFEAGVGAAAAANTGSGGGGGGNMNAAGGNGGSGLVVLRYPSSIGGHRDVMVTVQTGDTTGSVVAQTQYRYENPGWGEELVQTITDPAASALTTKWCYYTDSANRGSYRRVKSVTTPTGGWTAFQYYEDWDRRGQLHYQFEPFLNDPASATLEADKGRVIYFDYVVDWTGRFTRPIIQQEFINNTRSGQTTWVQGDNVDSGWPREFSSINSYPDGLNYQTDQTEHYRDDSPPNVAGQPYVSKGANLTQASFNQGLGAFDASTGIFTYLPGEGTHLRSIKVNGSTSDSGAELQSAWAGAGGNQPFPAVYLVPNKSTLETSITTPAGLVVRTETWGYTGAGTFVLLTFENFTYDFAGRLTQRVASNHATTDNTYVNGLLNSTVGPDGTETRFTYDALWRQFTATKIGVAAKLKAATKSGFTIPVAYAAQGDIITTTSYDGANHVVDSTTSGGASSVTTTAAFDLAGRQITQVQNAGSGHELTTTWKYEAGGRIVTTTLPGGGVRVAETFFDGRMRQVSGSAVVQENYNYWTDSGNLVKETVLGNVGAAVTTTSYDWLGRPVALWSHGWSGTFRSVQQYYNSLGQLWKSTRTGTADILYVYDTLGQLTSQGQDLNTNGTLDPASNDRIQTVALDFFNNGTDWWKRTIRGTYATDGSGTPTTLGIEYERLSGITAGVLAETHSYDINNNGTFTTVYFDRAGKTTSTRTAVPGSSTFALQDSHNGLLVATQDPTGVVMRAEYDELGRPSKSIDPRTGTTTTTYLAKTSLVDVVRDPANIAQATYTYDVAGRVATMTDAVGKVARYDYTPRGEKRHEWGDTTYPVEYAYDSMGRKITMTTYATSTANFTSTTWPGSPDNPQVTTWTYQPATGLLQEKTDAAGKKVIYTYDDADRMKTREWERLDPAGTAKVKTSYSYFGEQTGEALTGELRLVDYNDNTPDLSYTYNRLGNLSTVSDFTGTRTFTYNLAGDLQLQNEALPSSFYGDMRLTRDYETSPNVPGRYAGVRLGSAADPGVVFVAGLAYDTVGRIRMAVGFDYTYVPNSHLIATVSHTNYGYLDTRTYDPQHDWIDSRVTTATKTSATIASFAYLQDSMGRVDNVVKTGAIFNRYGNGTEGLITRYGYDERSQLKSERTEVGATTTILTGRDDPLRDYDLMGNRKTVNHNGATATYTANVLNQYSSRTVEPITCYQAQQSSSKVQAWPNKAANLIGMMQPSSVARREALSQHSSIKYPRCMTFGTGGITIRQRAPTFLAARRSTRPLTSGAFQG